MAEKGSKSSHSTEAKAEMTNEEEFKQNISDPNLDVFVGTDPRDSCDLPSDDGRGPASQVNPTTSVSELNQQNQSELRGANRWSFRVRERKRGRMKAKEPRRVFLGWVVLLCVVKPQREDFGPCQTKAGGKM